MGMLNKNAVKAKAEELGQKYFPNEKNIYAKENIEALKVEHACLEMAKWRDTLMVELINYTKAVLKACDYNASVIEGFEILAERLKSELTEYQP